MSPRSTQAGRMGYELASELRTRRVEIRWSGSKKHGSFGGWRVEWTDGPTVPHMRTLVEQRSARFPAVPVADLGYDRCHSSLSEAIALLLYIDGDRSLAACIETPLILSAWDSIGWPDRADQVWRDRAHALLRHTPQPEPLIITAEAVHALARQARAGWDRALTWLDRLAAEHAAVAAASNVVTLATYRAGARI